MILICRFFLVSTNVEWTNSIAPSFEEWTFGCGQSTVEMQRNPSEFAGECKVGFVVSKCPSFSKMAPGFDLSVFFLGAADFVGFPRQSCFCFQGCFRKFLS